jgi:glucose/arabinose dehydrogenase
MILTTNHQHRRVSLFSAFTFCLLLVLLAMWLALGALAAPLAYPGAISLRLEPFATGLSAPVDIANAGDSRLFVVERSGVIRIVQPTGAVDTTPFLDIRDRVNTSGSERGLLGLVFEPDNPAVFYVNYTLELSNPDDARNGNTIIARYRITGSDPDVADPNSEQVLLEIAQPFPNHNAGDLAFGPDKLLYVPLGDGGDAGDPQENAQDLGKLLGKVLRLDVIGKATYEIPADNPFVNDNNSNTLPEIWASGLRNPWRISFDRQTGDLYIGDVGQGNWEEIDFQPSDSSGGENYGWDCYEGTHDFETTGCSITQVGPIFEYEHTDGHCSVTGGYLYRGPTYPALQGHYLLADYCSGQVWSLTRDGQGNWASMSHGKLLDNPSTFGEDFRGDLYMASLNGTIYRLIDPTAPTPTATTPPDVPTIPAILLQKLYLPIVNKDGTN